MERCGEVIHFLKVCDWSNKNMAIDEKGLTAVFYWQHQ